MITTGNIIMMVNTEKANGIQSSLRMMDQRRVFTKALAERRAFTGVISGKATIYSAKIDALTR